MATDIKIAYRPRSVESVTLDANSKDKQVLHLIRLALERAAQTDPPLPEGCAEIECTRKGQIKRLTLRYEPYDEYIEDLMDSALIHSRRDEKTYPLEEVIEMLRIRNAKEAAKIKYTIPPIPEGIRFNDPDENPTGLKANAQNEQP
ncbi:hypothetical protein GCM10023091_42970 [Ravibacter arvi]|uniref:Uncharacterized protein n=1 Tax=Ravibacter arvi TaxID=2051041 RepID=A0ABP8MB41_9BACT